jgi:hypothetical protein
MDTPILFPANLAAFIALLVNPITMGILLSLLIKHVPFMQDVAVANWKKALFAVLICQLWALIVAALSPSGLPTTPTAWYATELFAVSVLFSNQAFYQIWSQIPCLRDFILQLFGKPVEPRGVA